MYSSVFLGHLTNSLGPQAVPCVCLMVSPPRTPKTTNALLAQWLSVFCSFIFPANRHKHMEHKFSRAPSDTPIPNTQRAAAYQIGTAGINTLEKAVRWEVAIKSWAPPHQLWKRSDEQMGIPGCGTPRCLLRAARRLLQLHNMGLVTVAIAMNVE